MKVQNRIMQTLSRALHPSHLEVVNESGMHNVPKGSETHFKVVAVSDRFNEMPLLARHRVINELLAEEVAGPVHALSVHAMTPDEWTASNRESASSPQCLGGGKRDRLS